MSDSSEEVQESADRVLRDSFAALGFTSANDVDVLQQEKENLRRAREELAYSLLVDEVERREGVLVRLLLLLLLLLSSSSSSFFFFFFFDAFFFVLFN